MQAGLGKELAELEGPELDGVQVILGSASSEENESARTEMVLTCPSKGAPAVTNVNTLPDGPGSLVRVLPSCMKRSVTVVALLLSKTLAHVLFARRHDNHLH